MEPTRFAAPPRPDEPEPYYGYRERTVCGDDGVVRQVRIPLTLWDLLHPEQGDVVMDSSLHSQMCAYLMTVFQARLADELGALVFHDVGVYWRHEEFTHHSPDISVILGVKQHRENWSSFDVVEQGVRPALIVEIVSPMYRVNDVRTKVEQYHKAKVPLYVIVDRDTEDGPTRLIGYSRAPRRYLPMIPDDEGRLWLQPVGVWLAASENRVVCYDENDELLGDYTHVLRGLQEQRQRSARAEQLAETEARRAEAEARRAEAEARRAEAEAAARAAADERVRQLEVRLRELGG